MTTDTDLCIVARSDRWVVIDKPAGLLSVPGKGEANRDCAPARLRAIMPSASGPITVHRLDMDTSGLLLMALDSDTQRVLSMQFEQRHVEKAYTALVDGFVENESGTIRAPIRPDYSNRPMQIVDRSHHREAVTSYRVMALETDRSRVELTPLTGRTHQLRVHCAHLGHPILGDVLYGPPRIDPACSPRLMLHAHRLVFSDPWTSERIEVRRPAPF